jgi:hypothetical protein
MAQGQFWISDIIQMALEEMRSTLRQQDQPLGTMKDMIGMKASISILIREKWTMF